MDRRPPAATARRQEGQAVAMIILFMFSLLSVSACVIDVGSWYQRHSSAQSVADAAALAGTSLLDASWSQAYDAARANFARNGSPDETITITPTTAFPGSGLPGGDSMHVVVDGTAPSAFAAIFGVKSVHIQARATATLESYTSQSGHIMPWAVMRSSFVVGASYAIYTDNTGSNNGTVNLPSAGVQADSSCAYPTTSGVSDLANIIGGTLDAGTIHIGDCLTTKPGGSPTPARQGLAGIQPWYDMSSAIQLDGNGQYSVLHDTPQLAIMPIVTNIDGTTTWGTGTTQLTVVGFAWFFVTGYSNAGKVVNGTFVKLSSVPQVNQSSGAYSPYGTATTVALTS
jgi:hypothetical protein